MPRPAALPFGADLQRWVRGKRSKAAGPSVRRFGGWTDFSPIGIRECRWIQMPVGRRMSLPLNTEGAIWCHNWSAPAIEPFPHARNLTCCNSPGDDISQ